MLSEGPTERGLYTLIAFGVVGLVLTGLLLAAVVGVTAYGLLALAGLPNPAGGAAAAVLFALLAAVAAWLTRG